MLVPPGPLAVVRQAMFLPLSARVRVYVVLRAPGMVVAPRSQLVLVEVAPLNAPGRHRSVCPTRGVPVMVGRERATGAFFAGPGGIGGPGGIRTALSVHRRTRSCCWWT